MNFFLYAITGKAFRHELKRLFSSIAVKMHLSKDVVIPKSTDRRTTAFNINYLANETYLEQRLKERRASPGGLNLLRSPPSFDSTVSNNNSSIYRHLRQQQPQPQQGVRKTMNDVTYCFQRISNV